jgi:hypothetical protein
MKIQHPAAVATVASLLPLCLLCQKIACRTSNAAKWAGAHPLTPHKAALQRLLGLLRSGAAEVKHGIGAAQRIRFHVIRICDVSEGRADSTWRDGSSRQLQGSDESRQLV